MVQRDAPTRDRHQFTTTIHVINSAIVKLSKLQRATTVFRVMSIPDTAEQHFKPDSHSGSCAGMEPGFTSTTASRHYMTQLVTQNRFARQARQAAGGSDEETIVVFRIRVIPTDLAADISFASQSPHDEEIVYASLSAFDVVGHYQDASLRATVVDLRPRRREDDKTVDQLLSKMKDAHIEWLDMMIEELRNAGAPEAALQSLNTLRSQRLEQEGNIFDTADGYSKCTADALQVQQRVLRHLSLEAAWRI